jgi:hypothetical protein
LEPEIFQKFMQFSKETNITLISTVNKFLKPGTMDLLSDFDFKHKLDFFTYNELYSILNQRALLSFSHEIDKNLIRYITDLICEEYVPVPGKGIEILRDLYPILKINKASCNFDLLEICQNQFDTFEISDEFNMINYLSEEDILTIVFLDNLSNLFLNKMKYYVSFNELLECYELSCEYLEYTKNNNEFYSLIEEMLNVGIIKLSKRTQIKRTTNNSLNNLDNNSFFTIVNPKQIKLIIDTIFNKQ